MFLQRLEWKGQVSVRQQQGVIDDNDVNINDNDVNVDGNDCDNDSDDDNDNDNDDGNDDDGGNSRRKKSFDVSFSFLEKCHN